MTASIDIGFTLTGDTNTANIAPNTLLIEFAALVRCWWMINR